MLLSELIEREVVIEWPEAVALVRAVLEQVHGARLPELTQIELLTSGQVKVHGAPLVSDLVGAAGEMLHALMSRSDPPVQLRLLNAQAHGSREEYYEALGFFERPNRAAVLLELYARAAAAAAIRRTEHATGDMGAFPSETEKPADERPRRAGIPSRTLVLAACSFAMLLIMGMGSWLASRTAGAEPVSDDIEAPAAIQTPRDQPSDASPKGIASAISSAVSAIENRLGLSGAAAANQSPEKPAVPQAVENRTSAPAPGSRTAGPGTRRFGRESAGAVTSTENRALVRAPVETGPSEPPVLSREEVTLVADTTIYSARSANVVAAEGRRPQLPSVTPATPGVGRSELRGIELVIRPDGSVESVKLVGPPRDIHDSMLLSAAKAWQFYPATKGGVPVRYRKTVWIPKEMWGQD
jgi:hypothetical protein